MSIGITFGNLRQDQRVLARPERPREPLVSVIMPACRLRPGRMTQAAIESVLSQTEEDFELIVVDDGSVDGLYEVLCDYQQNDPRIVIIRNEVNCGLPGARVNQGLLAARGKYAGYMFEDDLWLPDALEKLLETMANGADECVVYGATEATVHRPDGTIASSSLGDWDFNYALLKGGNKLANCSVLHARSLMERIGFYDPHILIRRVCDYDLWLRMGRYISFRRCPHVVCKIIHGLKHCIGATVQQDLALTFRYLTTNRDHLLVRDAIDEYRIDALDFIADAEEENLVREHFVIPFYGQHPKLVDEEDYKQVPVSAARHTRVLVTKGDYSTSVDVMIGNFQELFGNRAQMPFFLPENALSAATRWNYDTLMLYRTVGSASTAQVERAREDGKAILYFMDDNMLKFGIGPLAEKFSYLKPGTTAYDNVTQQVAAADAVISYSPKITEDCRRLNPRVLPLRTNIVRRHIQGAAPPEGGRSTGRRLKYAVLSGSSRDAELEALWPRLAEFAERHKDEIEFHFWGIDITRLRTLACPVFTKPFDHSYERYLRALTTERFDFVVCPLFQSHDAKASKSPVKYTEATAAGAVGIFSNGPVYRDVRPGLTGLKTPDDAWLEALEKSFELSDEARRELFDAAKQDILERFTTESQALQYLTVFEAGELHAGLKSRCAPAGRARIAYFFHESFPGGATLHLFEHALVAKQYGFEPILCVTDEMDPVAREYLDSESGVSGQPRDGNQHWAAPVSRRFRKMAEKHDLQLHQLSFYYTTWKRTPSADDMHRARKLAAWMQLQQVSMVHCVTYCADVALAANMLGIPCVFTLHAHYNPPVNQPGRSPDWPAAAGRLVSVIHSSSLVYAAQWREELDAPAFTIRFPVEDRYFALFAKRRTGDMPTIPAVLLAGTLQPRKGQLKAIQAVKILGDRGIKVKLVLAGYDDLVADYARRCRAEIRSLGLGDQVAVKGFSEDIRSCFESADYLLCASDDESMPQAILQAMAAGVRVVSTPVGGVTELIKDGFSGVITDGFEAEDIADAIQAAHSMPRQRWRKMLDSAHAAARILCTREVVAYQLLKLYSIAVRENRLIRGARGERYPLLQGPGLTFETPAQAPQSLPLAAPGPAAAPQPSTPGNVPGLAGLQFQRLVPGSNLPRAQAFRPPFDTISAIAFFVGTYGRTLNGQLNARISDPATGAVLRDVSLDLSRVPDNSPVVFRFTSLAAGGRKKLLLQLASNAGWPVCVYDRRRSMLGRIIRRPLNMLRSNPPGPPIYIHYIP